MAEVGGVKVDNGLEALDKILGKNRDEAIKGVVEYLRRNHKHYSWVGVYLLEGDELVLHSWSGRQATSHTRIPVGMGICGLAARTKETVVVYDVSKDPRYLECFADTKSEIVVPIIKEGRVLGEIDIDGDQLGAFNDNDASYLEIVAERLTRII
jgi:L-methionine (R)-S-oxide reductase